jgi:type II secretory pathway pseudopilin PulG
MKLRARNCFERLRKPESAGFTMVEIAIALGVIAFALIAIIGVLPSGLQVGRDNREETIINQDARLLLEAVRNGSRGRGLAVPGDIASFVEWTNRAGLPLQSAIGGNLSNLVQFLTQPGTNVAVMRAISGPVATRTTGSANDVPGFRYEVRSQVYPAFEIDNIDTNHLFLLELTNRTFEVRLLFRWPLRPDPKDPSGPPLVAEAVNRQVLRTILTGAIDTNGFFASQEFWPNPNP